MKSGIYKHGSPLALILLLLVAAPVHAAHKPTLSKKTFAVLQQTQEWLDNGRSHEAVTRLQALVKETIKKPYEQAVVLQTLGYAFVGRDDYLSAIPTLKRSLDMNALSDEVQQELRYNLAQLYMATDGFSEAIDILREWFRHTTKPKVQSYVMLGSAHLQLKRFKEAVPPLRKAVALSDAPKENWYQALLAAYSELKDYSNCVKLLHTMVRRFPDRSIYWRQLAGIELSRERYTEAVSIMELAYQRGHLDTERDLLNLAQLYSYLEAPYKSACLLEKEIANGHIKPSKKILEQATNAWYQAKEHNRAIVALARAAKIDGEDPALSLRLSQLYLVARRWGDAEKNLSDLLADKKLDDKTRGKAWISLGIAFFEQKNTEEANNAFRAAKKYSVHKDEAEQWLSFLDRKE